jgi:hypothetical protein
VKAYVGLEVKHSKFHILCSDAEARNEHVVTDNMAVPWLRSLVAGLSPRRPGFEPGSIHVGFVDKVALEQVFI